MTGKDREEAIDRLTQEFREFVSGVVSDTVSEVNEFMSELEEILDINIDRDTTTIVERFDRIKREMRFIKYQKIHP